MALTHSEIADAALSQMFAGMQGALEKAAAYAKEKNIDEAILLNWRLAPDMFAMSRQVQIACDICTRGLARLAGAEIPSFPDTEKSFEELRQRIANAQAFIKDLDKSKIDADPDGEVVFPVGKESMTMTRSNYLMNFILPNLYFHTSMCYANLRACGAPLGKADFLARPR
ncbi:MAG: DUF1993 family protein [Alphaproteobacteria bacterium]|nr:DUF1993 family protein [Alphaproteobacteria bacterium]